MAVPLVEIQSAPRSDLLGQLRSIGADGPTYEVVRFLDADRAIICILESEREVEYPIKDILNDPGADAAWRGR